MIGIMHGLYRYYKVYSGVYRDNGKENRNYYLKETAIE